uniref:Uncharacterized protein n=1 Tax=Panagrolaimus sp. ES5 TaxID=591445 RepID=A0AC34FCG9_9BILA
MDSTPNDITPKKSCLKKPSEPIIPTSSQNDETIYDDDIKFHFTESSDDDKNDSDSAGELPTKFVYEINKSPCADYRRVFSMDQTERNKFIRRKSELKEFFPPKNPSANDAKQRYEAGEKYFRELADLAWKDCASAQRIYKYEAMRKKINVDAIREKFNKKKPLPKKPEVKKPAASKTKRRITTAAAAADDDSSDHASGDDTYNQLEKEYLSNLPSTSLPRTTPALLKKNLHKKPKNSSKNIPVKDERSEYSFLDETEQNQLKKKRKRPKMN